MHRSRRRQSDRVAMLRTGAPLASAISAILATAPALAQETGLEEIVVTAQKRSESLQDVPLSIQAFTTEKLEQLKTLLTGSPGSASVFIHLGIAKRSETMVALGSHYQIKPTDELLTAIERLFGGRVAQLR